MVTSSVVPWKSFLLARTKEGDPSSNKIALWMSGLNDLKSGHVTPQQLVSKVAPSPKRLLLKHVFPKFEMEEIPNNHLGCIKPRKSWDKLPTSTGAGFCPSTVCICNLVVSGKKKTFRSVEPESATIHPYPKPRSRMETYPLSRKAYLGS